MADYRLISDVTADISESMMAGVPGVERLPMPVEIGGEEHLFGTEDGLTLERFYALLRSGQFATTAQIPPAAYMEAFEPILAGGEDVLYLCFTSGLSGSWESALSAQRELQERYPERKLICVDTLAASVGEGFLIREASRKKAGGMGIDELARWITDHRLNACHWFTVDGFTHLRHGGRVSSAVAAIGSVLNIKPLLRVDEEGRLGVVQKPRGLKAAMNALVSRMTEGWIPEMGRLVVIGHGDCPERARQLGERILAAFPDAEVHYACIGPVIGAHTGPDMLALVYWGSNR